MRPPARAGGPSRDVATAGVGSGRAWQRRAFGTGPAPPVTCSSGWSLVSIAVKPDSRPGAPPSPRTRAPSARRPASASRPAPVLPGGRFRASRWMRPSPASVHPSAPRRNGRTGTFGAPIAPFSAISIFGPALRAGRTKSGNGYLPHRQRAECADPPTTAASRTPPAPAYRPSAPPGAGVQIDLHPRQTAPC